jgi:glycosyltransferase involved in cell wall biosynthesis
VPAARLRLVGRHLPEDLAARARELGAEPVGFVDDLGVEFSLARAIVIPLWQGAGIRVKMIEAVAAGLPVVSTSLGAEGLGLVPGRDFLAGERPEELAAAAIELLERPERATALAVAAYAALKPRYEVETVARRTVALCEEALAARAARSA